MRIKILGIAMALAMIMVMALPMGAGAEDVVVTAEGGTGSITVTAPSLTSLGSIIGTGSATGTATDGSVLCTNAVGYDLTIESNSADGKMVRDGGTEKLTNALLVTSALTTSSGAAVIPGTAVSGSAVTTTPITMGGTAGGSIGTNAITLSVSQPKQETAVAGTYKLTLTYTASSN